MERMLKRQMKTLKTTKMNNMKNLKFFALLFLASLVFNQALFAQGSNVTDAILKFKKLNLADGLEPSKKILNEAKAYIDLAAVNTETATKSNMHDIRAKIYYSLMEINRIEAKISKSVPEAKTMMEYESKVIESTQAVMNNPKAKEKKGLIDFFNNSAILVSERGSDEFNKKQFVDATKTFMEAYNIAKYASLTIPEYASNTTLSFYRAMDTLMKMKEYEAATALGYEVFKTIPKNIDIIIPMINLNIQKKDNANLEKYLTDAINLDSTNLQIYLVLGNSLHDMKQYTRAEEAYLRAIKLDTNNSDAINQYGTFMFNWSRDVSNEASDLKMNDPKIDVLYKTSKDILIRITTKLDPFIKRFPEDKMALEVAWKTYYLLEDEVKSAALKKQWEALK